MSADRWARVKDLFADACDLVGAERSAYLDRECGGDAELRREVERLLAGESKAGARILDSGAPSELVGDLFNTGASPDDPVPEQIDHYRVLEVLGEGGMGRVYLAEQTEPVQRRVALKVIKLGMDTRQVLERFEAERQALARMEHDSIAKVFDAGTTGAGQSYFVMEYVAGQPITEYCDQQQLTARQRLELFVEVCAGVQHAHQKGVIHRDLKPSNILVTVQEGKAVAKIIDFGIAKATDQGAGPATEAGPTIAGQLIGTPEYMSPEQAGMGAGDVDTRTDVYALGVVLYQLLTGQLPFSRDELRRAGLAEIQRKIRQDDPPRPSTRVSSLGADAVDVARYRQTSSPGLVRELRGDLDWITMRALEKERDRRYATPIGLSDDIQRHLRHEPVDAGPPGARYRIGKFVRRYRLQVVASAALLVTLLSGIGGTTFFMLEAEDRALAERDAREQAQTNLANFNLLANVVHLREAKAAMAEPSMYPAWPGSSDALRAWIRERGEPLEGELPDLVAAMMTLRARAELTDTGWQFDSAADQFLHDTLDRLVVDMNSFLDPDRGELALVRDQLTWSETVRELSIVAPAADWQRARAAIAAADGITASARYAQAPIDLQPQMGLVPIGMNPVTRLWEFYHLASAADPEEIPQHDAAGQIPVSADTGMVFVLVPGGEFLMGGQADDPQQPNYDPQVKPHEATHHAEVGAFFLARHEMTQGQWLRLSHGANPSSYGVGWDRPDDDAPPVTLTNPVDAVSWEMSRDLLLRHGLDLPMEDEWELACRAGSTTPWSTGADRSSLAGRANVLDATAGRAVSQWGEPEAYDDGYIAHAPVGTFPANAFGFFDMHGNMWEWTRAGPESLNAYLVRGGGFNGDAADARSALRLSTAPNTISAVFGVRAARSVQE